MEEEDKPAELEIIKSAAERIPPSHPTSYSLFLSLSLPLDLTAGPALSFIAFTAAGVSTGVSTAMSELSRLTHRSVLPNPLSSKINPPICQLRLWP